MVKSGVLMSRLSITREFYLSQLAAMRKTHGIELKSDPLSDEKFSGDLDCRFNNDAASTFLTENAAVSADDASTDCDTEHSIFGDNGDLYIHMAPRRRICTAIDDAEKRCTAITKNHRSSYCPEHHKLYHAPKTKKFNISEKTLYGDPTSHYPLERLEKAPEYEHVW